MTEFNQMDNELINRLVAKVILRLLPQMGADGSRGSIVVICTGCTGDVDDAVNQLRNLVIKGFKLKLKFSETARQTYREKVTQGLNGFPHISLLNSIHWFEEMKEAEAVIVPLVSVNTVSRIALLMADSEHTQLMLNAMAMGKPLVIAQETLLSNCHAKSSQNKTVNATDTKLQTAIKERLSTVQSFGAVVCEIRQLSKTLESLLGEKDRDTNELCQSSEESQVTIKVQKNGRVRKHINDQVITASHVRLAAQGGFDLSYDKGGIITPMAKDLAGSKGIRFEEV